MTTVLTHRVSPEATTNDPTTNTASANNTKAPTSPSASSAADVSWTTPKSTNNNNKSIFLRRKRHSASGTVPTYTRSQSSSFMSDTESACKDSKTKPKRRSLLSRVFKKKTHKKKSLVIETTNQPLQDDTDLLDHSNDDEYLVDHIDNEDTAEIDSLQEQGQQLRLSGQVEEAFSTWQEAMTLAESCLQSYRIKTLKLNQIHCRMIDLHMELYDTESAVALMKQLKPTDDSSDDGAACFLTPTPQFLDLLSQQACWTFALAVANELPETQPITLARLHLEVALANQTDRTLAHLSECHQLLLSVQDDASTDPIWQELALAYASMGQEELAMAASQSRLQLVGNAPQQVALAHYDQALNVYSPVGQYGLALKEAELALTALKDNRDVPSTEGKEADDEVELLWIKLHQLKADILCRMGRVGDSIESYEQLLQAYLDSPLYGPVEAANVLYILGKLSVQSRRFSAAIGYFDRELQMTQSVVGPNHLAISKILHELAKVADVGMMDYPLAKQYYERALQVELAVFEQCRQQQLQEGVSPATSNLLNEARMQTAETKQCLGKLHFKMGDFATAVKTTLSQER